MRDERAAAPNDRLARAVAVGLGAGRMAIGAGIWLAPERTFRALGFAPRQPGPALALGRVAATRDLLMGAAQLATLADPPRLRRATTTAALADAGDALAFALALRARATRSAGVRGLAAAAAAAATGAWLATRARPRPELE
jgi:hypothetical protein